ncbi:TlyA family RNA methyltransferase [Rhabdothermincola salaria]|uniref:TlyA family RNA methyltransferase n=1 Tax=Rhabdothermincola salaria TaxID=2903142 RepID=UPI003D269900
MSTRRRLDAEMVRRGLAASRERARAEIEAGRVTVGGAPAVKAARLVGAGEAVVVHGPGPRYVSRAGEKLAGAVDRFDLADVVSGARVLDAGASTGGFTDCVLQHGAKEVVAVDVGHNQLHERLRADPRVHNLERTNLRILDPAVVGEPVDVAVGDLSFISLRLVLDPIFAVVRPGGAYVLLVKPQFEAGRAEANRGRGVISDPLVWRRVLDEVAGALIDRGATIMGAMASPLTGADGNVEFVVAGRAPGAGADASLAGRAPVAGTALGEVLDAAVGEAVAAPAEGSG